MSETRRDILRAIGVAALRIAGCGLVCLVAAWCLAAAIGCSRRSIAGSMAADYLTLVIGFMIDLPRGWIRDGTGLIANLIGPSVMLAMGAPSLPTDGAALPIGFFAFLLTFGRQERPVVLPRGPGVRSVNARPWRARCLA